MKRKPTYPNEDDGLVEHKAMDAAMAIMICAAGLFLIALAWSFFCA